VILKIIRLLFIVFLLIIILNSSACASLTVDKQLNPSYRLITNQILEIDSALGIRGGLAALTKTSALPATPARMSHGASIEPASPRATRSIKLNWALIARRVSTIENAWKDVRIELERRQYDQVSESWNAGYSQYYQIMATIHYFDTSLEYVKVYVAQKNSENIELSVTLLTDSFIQVKDELKVAETDGRRLFFVLGGFVGMLAAFTVTSSVVARRRDFKLLKLHKIARNTDV
jgi:hypothetical protein